MTGLLLIWVLLGILLVVFGVGRPGEGGALTLAYFGGLAMIHVPGVVPFAFAESVPVLFNEPYNTDPDATWIGFAVTIAGMSAFVLGAVLARVFDRMRGLATALSARQRGMAFRVLGRRALIFGALAYFVLIPPSRMVPSMTSIVGASATLLILGLWLALYGAVQEGDARRVRIALAVLPLLPLGTLITGGYLGYGIYWVLSVLAFVFVILRRRVWFYVAAPVAVYLGLSLFVSYMAVRQGIRDVVWNGQSSFAERLDRVSSIVTDFQLLDLGSARQVSYLDSRLNQNALVGLAVQHIDSGWAELGYGDTVAPWALIPRAVWPDKPWVGGGRDVVSRFTGLVYDPSTSVGAGQVLEFYVNFGLPGELIGFLLWGFGLMWLDRGIMRALAGDDVRGVLLRALPGLMLLQPGGNLLEILVAVVAALLVAHVTVHVRAFSMISGPRARRQAI